MSPEFRIAAADRSERILREILTELNAVTAKIGCFAEEIDEEFHPAPVTLLQSVLPLLETSFITVERVNYLNDEFRQEAEHELGNEESVTHGGIEALAEAMAAGIRDELMKTPGSGTEIFRIVRVTEE